MFNNPKEICIRKHFKRWGHEMNKDTSPIETGLMPFVRYIKFFSSKFNDSTSERVLTIDNLTRMKKKTEFIGKAGLAKLMQVPASSTIVFLRSSSSSSTRS